jgi:predicted phosphodiesterase
MSDIHVELTRGWDLPASNERPTFNVAIVAGDLIPRMERGVRWLAERFRDRTVLYVPGNHEFYGVDIMRTVEKARAAAEGTNVVVMQNDSVTIGGVTYIGATMWTDFLLHGDQAGAMAVAGDHMNDFRKIRCDHYRDRFRPHHALARHMESRAFFESEFRKPRSGPLVAISHHAPHRGNRRPDTIPIPGSDEDILSAAFRSDLTHLMVPAGDDGRGPLTPADVWIFGHTHESEDVVIGATRVISNAKGYGPWGRSQPTSDNPRFDPKRTIQI